MRMDDPTLAQLMRRAQGGDAQAYRAVLDNARLWLYRYIWGKVAPQAVDDLVQDILLAVHAKRASYDADRPFLPWLAAIARYRWVDHLRSHYRHVAEDIADHDGLGEQAADEAIIAHISIDRMLDQLSQSQATAIRLVKLDGLSVREAAQRCGQSEANIKVNIHRGLKRLSANVESV
jgi:RNA polymerase sigma factor (sigma-70 family)